MKRVLALAAAIAFAAPALADSVTVSTDDGTPIGVYAVPEFTTTGADMSGMFVTVYFSNQTSSSAYWATTGATSGAASDSETFRLQITGDTYANTWQLENLYDVGDEVAITGFSIDAIQGNTVFDAIATPEKTPGSALGYEFDSAMDHGFSLEAVYRNVVGVFPNAPIGDLFGFLDVKITDGWLGGGSSYYFNADTDNVVPTPEPATMALLGLGLGGAAWRRRRQRRQAA